MASRTSTKAKRPSTINTAEGFIIGGIAACVAVTISNPAEVAKTRLQLQGELAKGGGVKNEGIRGIQRGLGPAYSYQILLNGSRLGFYEPFRLSINKAFGFSPTDQLPATSIAASAASGAVGAVLGNPLFMAKARMQAYSPALPVGAQHNYKSGFDALRSIFVAQGARGLVRGVDAAVLRTSMGSLVQLPTYNWTKNQLISHGISRTDSIWTYLACSSVSGICVLLMMQPADTTLTRMYNQPTKQLPDGRHVGTLYKGPIDRLWKKAKTEGIMAWYKGSTAHN
ncbi:hypothetical protein EUX98_g7405 [Antrodiella citrinella]|uniref:Mitochondrial carrier n=1 Tax=Antrodiella citrinella TaxID=2447956 RepID=A0A4V3XHV9_9APHY|nr:hypothetical protein EUX98_g7405 [Antrodiella citrinella]